MTSHEENKPQEPRNSADSPEIPAATRNWLSGLLSRERDSVLWTISPVAGDSISRGLAERGAIAVRVQGWNQEIGEPMILQATLTRQAGPAGGSEFALTFDQPLAAGLHPYALWVGKLDLWSFQPLSLGNLSEAAIDRVERDSGATTADEESYASSYGGLAAAGAGGEALRASHERLDLYWRDGLLEIRLACPPLRVGQPVVVETTVRDAWDGLRTTGDVVSVEDRITEGPFAGYVLGTTSRWEPDEIELDDLRITVRPLRVDDMSLLNPRQIASLLACQRLTVLTTRIEGTQLRAAAEWDDQQHAVSALDSTWLVRVATRKEGR